MGAWGPTITDLGAFALNNIGGSGDTLQVSGDSATGTFHTGGLDSGGCDNSGNFICFSYPSSGVGAAAVASDMLFNISVLTGSAIFDLTGTGQDAPHLKVQFLDSAGDKVSSLYSEPLNGQSFAIPEPATWMMMIIGVGMVGGVMRRRRKMALATN
jgi:hypothetical protein